MHLTNSKAWAADEFQVEAGISGDWSHGCGCYISKMTCWQLIYKQYTISLIRTVIKYVYLQNT